MGLPAGAVVQILCIQCRGHRISPRWENWDPMCRATQSKNKKAKCESCKSYFGENEDYNPGDSIEKLWEVGSLKRPFRQLWEVRHDWSDLAAAVSAEVGKYMNWDHEIDSWRYLPEDLSCQFLPELRVPVFCSPPLTPVMLCYAMLSHFSRVRFCVTP